MSGQLKVLSVVGAGRSGTTVLASILGEVAGVCSAGELRWLWERGVLQASPCGCGLEPTACPVWGPVIARGLSDVSAAFPGATTKTIVAAQRELKGIRSFRRALAAVEEQPAGWKALEVVRVATRSECLSLASLTASRVVVDTSKRPLDAAVLAGIPEVDHFVLHLVRDPRAVVHSWRRSKTFTAAGVTRSMGTRRLAPTVRRWLSNALQAEALRRVLPRDRWLAMTYEEFASSPRSAISAIMDFLGESGAPPFLDDHTVALRPNHIVAGNPSRFTTGSVTIRSDEEWQRRMPRSEQTLVSVMTFPLMRRYGYLHHS